MSLLAEPVHLHPRPPSRDDRWQPTRAGLINLWRYWDETFTFHDGRLLLRGPNGSGKSMALELLLPFLIDGDASPAKLTSAAKSRGGLYERVMTGTADTSRVGFAWVEFRRGDEVFTVGARLRASTSTRAVARTLFSTTQAVGEDLDLLDAGQTPRSRGALAEAIGDHGRVTDTAAEHRDAVRATLFPHFSADRYDALVNALLALRKEKLSQHLDLDKLNEVMSEALPAIDEHELAAVAEGFERLDRRRDELGLLRRDSGEVDGLVQRQRAYARAVVASVADEVRRAASTRDGIVRRQRTAADELAEAVAAIELVQQEDETARGRLRAIAGELDGIRSSDLYREGAHLAQLRHDLGAREAERDRLGVDLGRRRDEAVDASRAVDGARQQVDTAAANLAHAERELRSRAEEAGAGPTLDEALGGEGDPADREAAGRLLGAWVRARRAVVAQIGRLLHEHGRAVERRRDAEVRVDEQRQRVDALTAEQATAARRLDETHLAFVQGTQEWVGEATAWSDPWRESVRAAVAEPAWAPTRLDAAVGMIASEHATQAALSQDDLDRRRSLVVDERAEHVARMDELEAGGLPHVVPPTWRSPREGGRAGAPLWTLVDVLDGSAPDVVDGIESALRGAGLIDAWVSPTGVIDLVDGRADITLVPLDIDRRPDRSLADHLQPSSAAGDDGESVAPAVVGDILASIAVTDSAVADRPNRKAVVGLDGTFRLAGAVGRGPAGRAQLLGAAAREQHRRSEIERVGGLIDEGNRRERLLDAEEGQLASAALAFTAHLERAPSRRPCDDAAQALADAESRLGEADAGRRAEEERLRSAEDAVRDAQRTLALAAADSGAPADEAGLSAFSEAVEAVDVAAGVWARRAGERAVAAERAADLRTAADRAAGAAADAEAAWQGSVDAVTTLSAKVDAIGAAVGADFDELMDRVDTLEAEHRDLGAAREALAERRHTLDRRQGTAEQALATATDDLAAAEEARARVHGHFVDLHAGPLPVDAGLEPPVDPLDGVTAVLNHARRLATDLDGVTSEADEVERLSRAVERRLHETKAAVGIRVDLDRHPVDGGWLVVRGSAGGIRRGLVDLQDHLRRQLAEATAELHAQEEALFERTLSGSVRAALAERIRGANELVDAINTQLSEVQTAAAGVGVRLRWRVGDDQPDTIRTARSLLLRDPADLTDDQRSALTEFVRARVDQARAELEQHAPWEERLRASLDYRAWHRFTLQVAHRDWEGFKPATAGLLQRLSTGERSVALHLPMIASIAAHYTGDDGRPAGGPRLILLDELFAGVDTANRAQLFGTFTTWDLDAVFTSDHEWCQYASLKGIAIHHLQGGMDDEPVTSTRFTWDGRERRLEDAGVG